MVHFPKMYFSPHPAGGNGKSTKRSTKRRHQANEGKSGFKAERVRGLGALRSLRSKKMVAAEKQRESHFLSNEENEKWIEDFVDRETAGARKRVEDAEEEVQQEQDDMTHAELVGLNSRKPRKTFEEMMVALGDSLSDLASSDDGEDGEDEDDEDTEQGKLSEHNEPGWVMGTITKTVEQRMERFRQNQLKFNQLTQPGWEDAADYFREPDKTYGTAELRVPAVVQHWMNDDALPHPPTTFAELMESLHIVPGISEGTSPPGSSHIRLGSMKQQSQSSIPSGEPAVEPDLSQLLNVKPLETVSFYPCIWPPANHHIDIGFWQRDRDGSCFCGRRDMPRVIFDV